MGDAVASEPVLGLLSIPEAARLLRVDPKTLRKAAGRGQVKTVRLSGALRIPAAEVERLLAAAG